MGCPGCNCLSVAGTFNLQPSTFKQNREPRSEHPKMLSSGFCISGVLPGSKTSMKRVRKGVIPAAGLGTRFLPATKAIPKEMLPIVDKPTIQYVVEEAVASGVEDIVFVTGRGKTAIEDHFDYDFRLDQMLERRGKKKLLETVRQLSSMVSVVSVRQKEPLGLGNAVLVSEPFVGNEPFAVFLGDDIIEHEVPAMRQMLEVFRERPGSILAVQEVPPDRVSRYGIVGAKAVGGSGDRLLRVEEMVEKPTPQEAPSNLAIMGRYLLMPEIFESLRSTSAGAIGEIQLTDGIAGLIARGHPVYAYRLQGKRYDAGDKLEYLMATVEMALKHKDIGAPFREYLHSLELDHDRDN